MTTYMLKSGQKRQPLVGLWTEVRGRTNIVHKVDMIFSPGEVVDTTLDFDSWVPSILKIVNVDIPDSEVPIEGSEAIDTGAGESNDNDDGVTEKEEGLEGLGDDSVVYDDVDTNPEPDSGDAEYKELEDGTFKCLHCGKVLKTKNWMVKHVSNTH